MHIPQMSDIYWQGHTGALVRSRVKGDPQVNHALDCTLERESQWTQKQSSVAVCQKHLNTVQTKLDIHNSTWNQVKRVIKSTLEDNVSDYWKGQVEPLLVQGQFVKLLLLADDNLTWKSIMYNLPKGVLSFVTNACIDSLPSYTNLYRWGKRLSNKCTFCPQTTGTLHHILNNCTVCLERYEWRHNNILRFLYNTATESLSTDNAKVYADIDNFNVAGGTIPPHILVTSQRPDLVIIWESTKTILMIELTVPFETNIEDAHERKLQRYKDLTHDIRNNGYEVEYYAIEVGARGQITKDNKYRLKKFLKKTKSNTTPTVLYQTITKYAIVSSFVIFYARKERLWGEVKYLEF